MSCPVHHSEHFGNSHVKQHSALAAHPDCACEHAWPWSKPSKPRGLRGPRHVPLTRDKLEGLYTLVDPNTAKQKAERIYKKYLSDSSQSDALWEKLKAKYYGTVKRHPRYANQPNVSFQHILNHEATLVKARRSMVPTVQAIQRGKVVGVLTPQEELERARKRRMELEVRLRAAEQEEQKWESVVGAPSDVFDAFTSRM